MYLLAPDGQYYDLHYRNLRRPPISLWEHRLALKRLRDEGRQTVDENDIFRAIETMRSITDKATNASKTARRQRERRLRVIQGGRARPAAGDATDQRSAPCTTREQRPTLGAHATRRGMVMSDAYGHLHASIRGAADDTPELRIRRIRTDRWVSYTRAESALASMEGRSAHRRCAPLDP